MTLAVQPASSAGVLYVDLGVARPDNWLSPHQTAVAPEVVREVVRAAHAAGWQPDAGGTFTLSHPLIRDRS